MKSQPMIGLIIRQLKIRELSDLRVGSENGLSFDKVCQFLTTEESPILDLRSNQEWKAWIMIRTPIVAVINNTKQREECLERKMRDKPPNAEDSPGMADLSVRNMETNPIDRLC
jgi:hypothetical protein